jgi:peptide/nickel transport system substrate-binding protein
MADEGRILILRFKIKWIITVLILILMTAGCSHMGKTDSANPVKAQMKKGGQLVYGSLQEPNTLNPYLSDFLSTSEVSSLIFSGLVTTNNKGEWIPDLALRVPTIQNGGVSPDGLTVTYNLRHGVTWQDGAPFTSADVKFTWQVIMNPKVNIISRDGYDKISAIDTPDPYTVVIHFKEHYAPFLTLFKAILPMHILQKESDINKAPFNRAPVGTGPFKFKEWRIGESIILEANPNYFRGRPNLDTIVYRYLPDAKIMLDQLKVGELDIMGEVPFDQMDQVKAINGVKTVITPNMIWEHLDFNLDNPIFQDVRVRRAISLGIDKQAIIKNVLRGAASPAAGDQSPLSWSYNPAMAPTPYDVNAAKALLKQAGWSQDNKGIFAKNGHELAFTLTVPIGIKVREQVAQLIAQQLEKVGIAVTVRPIDSALFFNDVLKHRRFETALYAWVGGVEPDDYSLWNSKRIPSAANGYTGQNYPGWRNAEIDALTAKGASSLDIETRKQAYFRIQELIRQDCPVIPLYFRSNISAVKVNVANYLPNPTPAGNLWNAWQWGFYAS